MKKKLLMSALVCLAFSAFTQEKKENNKATNKGGFIADGSIYFLSNSSKNKGAGYETKNNFFNIGIRPKVAYFIVDRLALGIVTSVGYNNNKFTSYNGDTYSSEGVSVSVGLFARYYLLNNFFGSASFGVGTYKRDSDTFDSKSILFKYQLGFGYAFFLNEHISLDPIISYQYNKNRKKEPSISETTNNGIRLGAGLTVYL